MLFQFWSTVTAPQATIVAALLTILAAVFGVALGWRLFGGKVRDLKSALDKSDELLRDHLATATKAFEAIEAQLRSLEDVSRSTTVGIAQISGDIAEIGDAQASANEPSAASVTDLSHQASMKDNWTTIRNRLETAAAGSNVDGRTRAKYARIDRRRYRDLVDAMADDGVLGANATEYLHAIDIWSKYRSGRSTPTSADSAAMAQLVDRLAAVPL